MTCQERDDLILLDAMDALDASEREELYAHLQAGCPRCEGRVAEAKALVAMIPLSLEPIAPPGDLRNRLIARLKSQGEQRSGSLASGAGARQVGFPSRFLLGAAAGVLIASGIFAWLLVAQHDRLDKLHDDLLAQQSQMHDLQSAVHQAEKTVQFISSPSVRVVGLDGTQVQPSAKARIFLDADHRRWMFLASNLKPLASSKAYELWLITGSRKIPVGMLQVDEQGRGSTFGSIPDNADGVVAAAVTDEPAAGVSQPTGAIQLLGKL